MITTRCTVTCRSVPSRSYPNLGTYMAWLETPAGTNLGTTRGHTTWSAAVRAAIALGHRRGHEISNEESMLRSCEEREELARAKAGAR